MTDKELRIECLRLAQVVERSPEGILARAKMYEDHVNGAKELAKNSENKNSRSKPDNAK